MKKIIFILLIVLFTQSIFAHGGEITHKTENLIVFNENDVIITTEILVSDWVFSSPVITINPENNNRLIFVIDSGHHGIRIPRLGLETGNMETGDFVIWDLTESRGGEYTYYCNIPCGRGHKDMVGTILIN